MTNFYDLLHEEANEDVHLLVDSLVQLAYGGTFRRIIVQRADGSIWEAWESWLDDIAKPWSLAQMEYGINHPELFNGTPLDFEALWHYIAWMQGADEAAAAIEQAEYLITVARRIQR